MTGAELKAWRIGQRVSIAMLAHILDRHKRTLHAYEAAELPIPRVFVLALERLGYPGTFDEPERVSPDLGQTNSAQPHEA